MPRITAIKVEPFNSVQLVEPGERIDITEDVEHDIAQAVLADHDCTDSSCDITYALEAAEAPYTAAGLLSGATECARVDAVICAHAFNGDLEMDPRRDVYASPDWKRWKSFHDECGRQCPHCEAFNYAQDTDYCGNCQGEITR